MPNKILDSVSAPTVSKTFSKPHGGPSGTVYMRNDADPGDLTAGDSADIQISHDKGVTWMSLMNDGVLVQLTDQNNHESVYGPGLYRLNLTAVTGPVSAYFV